MVFEISTENTLLFYTKSFQKECSLEKNIHAFEKKEHNLALPVEPTSQVRYISRIKRSVVHMMCYLM